MSLEALMKKHGTDKYQHGYYDAYELLFEPLRASIVCGNLLEIGVWKGESLRLWQEWLPTWRITGLDSNRDIQAWPGDDTIKVIIGDQTDNTVLQMLAAGTWDVIIDDGSHLPDHHLKTFAALWPSVKPGGYYVVEDLHTLFQGNWTPDRSVRTIVKEVISKVDDVLQAKSDIRDIHIFSRTDIDGILFLRKR